MNDSKKNDDCCEKAFEIALKGGILSEEQDNIFKELRGILDKQIVKQIDSFKPGKKGILLARGDHGLQNVVVSYIWFKHRLHYHMLNDEIVKEGMIVKEGKIVRKNVIQVKRPPLIEKNFLGYNNEEEIETILFKDGLMENHKLATVLFFRDIDVKFTKILERLSVSVRDFKFMKTFEQNPLYRAVYGHRKKILYYVWYFNILIISTAKPDELPANFKQNYETIYLEPGMKKTVLVKAGNRMGKNQSSNPTRQKEDSHMSKVADYNWSIKDTRVVCCNGQDIVKLAPLEFKLFKCLYKKQGKNVKNKTLEMCWEGSTVGRHNLTTTMNHISNKLKNGLADKNIPIKGAAIEPKKEDSKNVAYKLVT